MSNVNFDKHIWVGWTVRDFVDSLEPSFDTIMSGQSWKAPFTTKEQIKIWCMENQPYYKKYIPDVVNYFLEKIKK